jgi:hypothetical protein
MKSDGPLILAVVLLACGLSIIFAYGLGTASFSAGYPLSAANLHMSIATSGPAAVGGLGLVVLGLLAMAWALLCAVAGLFRLNGTDESRLERMESKRLKQEEKLERERLKQQERLMKQENRLRAATFPRE